MDTWAWVGTKNVYKFTLNGHFIGFLYASGLSVNASQAKALVHYMFGAIGGNTWAQMAIGYRYFAGASVSPFCEKSLDFYRQVAEKGKLILIIFDVLSSILFCLVSQGVSFSGGAAIQRIRLLDDLENGYTSGILDNDLFEYYQLLAEKGDVQAQVLVDKLNYSGWILPSLCSFAGWTRPVTLSGR